MRTLKRETYYCDHCNKMYISKYFCGKHEIQCGKNPNNKRDCFDCKGLVTDYIGYTQHDKDGNLIDQRSVKVFYCSLIDVYVTPPKAENKGNMYVLEKDNINMPKICGAKEDKTAEDYFDDLMKPYNKNKGSDFQ